MLKPLVFNSVLEDWSLVGPENSWNVLGMIIVLCFFSFRGYGLSDHPVGKDKYKGSYLVNDVKEVVSWNFKLMVVILYNNYVDNREGYFFWSCHECG